MLRRAVLALNLVISLGAICLSLGVDAQQTGKVWRIGVITNSLPATPDAERIWNAFLQTLQERGYVEGKNLAIERRYLEGKPEKAPVG